MVQDRLGIVSVKFGFLFLVLAGCARLRAECTDFPGGHRRVYRLDVPEVRCHDRLDLSLEVEFRQSGCLPNALQPFSACALPWEGVPPFLRARL